MKKVLILTCILSMITISAAFAGPLGSGVGRQVLQQWAQNNPEQTQQIMQNVQMRRQNRQQWVQNNFGQAQQMQQNPQQNAQQWVPNNYQQVQPQY